MFCQNGAKAMQAVGCELFVLATVFGEVVVHKLLCIRTD